MRILKIALIAFLFSQQSFADGAPAEPAKSTLKQTPNVALVSQVGIDYREKVNSEIGACNQAAETAHTYCLSQLNPKIQAASGLIGTILSGAVMMKSMSESCQEYSKALRIAEMALTAYNGMCSAAQMNCESTCNETKGLITTTTNSLTSTLSLKQTEAKIQPPTPDSVLAAAEATKLKTDLEAIRPADISISDQYRVCQGYKMNLAGASVGLMNIVRQSTLSGTCTNATTTADCSKNPSDPSCLKAGQENVDCSKNENQNKIQCICQRAPNTQGCPGASLQSSLAPMGSNSAASSGQSADKIQNPDLKGADSMQAGGGSSAAGGGGLAGGGGGGAGGGLGSGQNKAGSVDGKKNEKALNTNILSGYDGGGGGGGGRGGGRGDQPNSAYNAYLPGGAKDPSRGLASKTFGNGEVTAAGSKSNWEKISERYKDNKPTLMGP